MDNFSRFKAAIQAYRPSDFEGNSASKPELLIPEQSNQTVKTYYAPFESINSDARLILVGITPGRTQMNDALKSACHDLQAGLSDVEVLRRAKQVSAFSGSMRKTLCELLDRWKVPQLIGAPSASSLWNTHAQLVHFTSSLRNPVFLGVKEENYTGRQPTLHTYRAFQSAIDDLEQELLSIPGGLIFPLGSSVAKLIGKVVSQGRVSAERVLNLHGEIVEFPHPSGTNGERCKLVLLDNLPTAEDYYRQMSKLYLERMRSKDRVLTGKQLQRYASDRRRYWEKAEKSRKALQDLWAT